MSYFLLKCILPFIHFYPLTPSMFLTGFFIFPSSSHLLPSVLVPRIHSRSIMFLGNLPTSRVTPAQLLVYKHTLTRASMFSHVLSCAHTRSHAYMFTLTFSHTCSHTLTFSVLHTHTPSVSDIPTSPTAHPSALSLWGHPLREKFQKKNRLKNKPS